MSEFICEYVEGIFIIIFFFARRISSINCNYSLCRTYPALIVCPKSINDDQLKSLAKSYKNQRIPVPIWRHQNGAVILRSALSLAKGVMGMLKTGTSNASMSKMEGKTDGLQDQDRYFCAIIPQQPQQQFNPHHHHHHQQQQQQLNSGLNVLNPESNISGDMHLPQRLQLTPTMRERKNYTSTGIHKVLNNNNNNININSNLQKISTNWESLKSNASDLRDYTQYDDHYNIMMIVQNTARVPLYFLSERTQSSKSIRLSELGAEYIAVQNNDNRHAREAFKKLMRACLPSNINSEPDHTFIKLIESSDWLQQIRTLLQLSSTVVDLIDIQEANVNISFEDGWDTTCQVSSLAQICLDPFYRTIEGFRVLIGNLCRNCLRNRLQLLIFFFFAFFQKKNGWRLDIDSHIEVI